MSKSRRSGTVKDDKSSAQLSSLCRNLSIRGRRTSVRMERFMWDSLDEICRRESLRRSQVATMVDLRKGSAGLTGSLRVFIIGYFRAAANQSVPDLSDAIPDLSPTLTQALLAVDPPPRVGLGTDQMPGFAEGTPEPAGEATPDPKETGEE